MYTVCYDPEMLSDSGTPLKCGTQTVSWKRWMTRHLWLQTVMAFFGWTKSERWLFLIQPRSFPNPNQVVLLHKADETATEN